MKTVDKELNRPAITNTADAHDNAAPRKPQPVSHRGTSFD